MTKSQIYRSLYIFHYLLWRRFGHATFLHSQESIFWSQLTAFKLNKIGAKLSQLDQLDLFDHGLWAYNEIWEIHMLFLHASICISSILQEMADAFDRKAELEQALCAYLEAFSIMRKELGSSDPEVVQVVSRKYSSVWSTDFLIILNEATSFPFVLLLLLWLLLCSPSALRFLSTLRLQNLPRHQCWTNEHG